VHCGLTFKTLAVHVKTVTIHVDKEITIVYYKYCNQPDYLYILWHVDPLLGNDSEISKYTQIFANKRVSTATIGYSNRNDVFCAVRAEML
jgi:hypothetical protein